ncbi:hypothetical protein FNV43_RR00755 [Rhamnella rubrinervis]|uniref:Uncharacterized protein n=1 Tax=Rhamnella rubrinervis TaxID=2594499 RepID=A0A8K0HNE5_9ROSA|nr:hypothetical protein FNV43_RR00755 [Rhamnella rubrinervis]
MTITRGHLLPATVSHPLQPRGHLLPLRVGKNSEKQVGFFCNCNSLSTERQGKRRHEVNGGMDFFGDMEEQGSTMEMDVDNVNPLEILGEGLVFYKKLADADFFNSFEDDFDDSDVNGASSSSINQA